MYVSRDFSAEKKILDSSEVVRGENDEVEET